MFHLTTHAFFKALLFLGAGSVIHGLHGQQDIMKMGGLKSKMPQTFMVMLLASIAIAGIFPFAGFFSKDEILWEAFSGGHRVVWAVLVVAAVMTAFYMFRMMRLVFWGEHRGDAHAWDQAHESPAVMTLPLWVLAGLSVFGGWLNVPHVLGFLAGAKEQLLHHWLAPALSAVHGTETHHASAAVELGLMGSAIALAAAGILAAWVIYKGLDAPRAWAGRSGPLYPLLRNLYWVDELYDVAVLRPFYRLSKGFGAFDRWVVDGLVNAAGIVTDLFGQLIKLMQTGYVRNYAFLFMLGVLVVLAWLSAQ